MPASNAGYRAGWQTPNLLRQSGLRSGLDISGQLTPARLQELAGLWDSFQATGFFGPSALDAARTYTRGLNSGGSGVYNTPAWNWALATRQYGPIGQTNVPEWFEQMLTANPMLGSRLGRGTGAGQWGIESAIPEGTERINPRLVNRNVPTGSGWQGPWGRSNTGQFTGYMGEGGVHGSLLPSSAGSGSYMGSTQGEYDERSRTNRPTLSGVF